MSIERLGIVLPSAVSSDEEKRLYDLQMSILDTSNVEDWKALMEKLEHYSAAVRAAEARKGYTGGWRDALEAVGQHAEELSRQ